MEDKNDLRELLVSYLLNELNTDEQAYVINAIDNNPEIKQEFEDFKKLLRLVDIKKNADGINLVQERKRLDEMWQLHQRGAVSAVSEQTIDIGEVGSRNRSGWRFGWYARVAAVAAIIILSIGIGWRLLHDRPAKELPVVLTDKATGDKQKMYTRYETNVTGQTRHFTLQDGTEVSLGDQSVISFSSPFTGNKRDIDLKGMASFKVAKDKSRPFTVYSDGISTTALGTEFTVTSFEKGKTITIRLIEGRIVVKSADSVKRKFSAPYYLLPGQELVYDKERFVAVVGNFRNDIAKDMQPGKENTLNDNPSLPKNNQGNWFMFNNQSLSQIFDQLELIYNVEIVYDRKDTEKLYFIGQFDKKDSLEYILKSITNLNSLKLSKLKNKYIIHK